jgi:hypothetical protein
MGNRGSRLLYLLKLRIAAAKRLLEGDIRTMWKLVTP